MRAPIPHEQRRLSMFAHERGAPPWGDELAARLIDLLAGNPWQSPREAHAAPRDPWQPFDRDAAVAMFRKKRMLTLRSGEDLALDGSLSNVRARDRGVVRLSMIARLVETRPVEEIEAYLATMISPLPHAASASASADDDQILFARERKLPFLPDLVGSLGWLHVLCPGAYAQYWGRSVLLAAPCRRVEERDDGTIWIWVYEHPLRYDDPEARDVTAELYRYLDAHVKEPA